MIVPTASPDLRPLRILLIQDDDRLQRIVRRVFEHERGG